MATSLPRRAVRCPVHGLHYDPQLTRGCVRCRREGLLPHARPKFLPLLLSLLALTIVAARLVTAILDDVRTPEPVPQTVARSAAAGRQWDPERYRPAIERIEQALYPTAATDLQALGDRVAAGSKALAERLRGDGFAAGAQVVAAFGENLSRADFDARGLGIARDRWTALRARIFLPAAWMKTGLEPGETDPVTVVAYLDLANAIDGILDRAQAGSSSDEWRQSLGMLGARMPPAPAFGADSALILGFNELEQAMAAARTAAGDQQQIEAALTQAREHVGAGRSHLTDLLG